MSDKGIENLLKEMYEMFPWQYCEVVLDDVSDYSRMFADAAIIKCMNK